MNWPAIESQCPLSLIAFRNIAAPTADEIKTMHGAKLASTLYKWVQKFGAENQPLIDRSLEKLMKKVTGVGTAKPGEKVQRHSEIFRVLPIEGDVQWPGWMKAEPCSQCIIRCTADGTFSASGEANPYCGMSGALKSLQGDLCITVLPPNWSASVVGDLPSWLQSMSNVKKCEEIKKAGQYEKQLSTAILKNGEWMWVPFGSLIMAYGIEEQRPQTAGSDGKPVPKRKRVTRKKSETEASTTTQGYSSYLFLPCVREEDAHMRPDIVQAFWSRWTLNKAYSPKKFQESPPVQRWSGWLEKKIQALALEEQEAAPPADEPEV